VTYRNPLDHQPSQARITPIGQQPYRPLAVPARILESVTLFRGEHEIGIEHQGALYRLKITRQGKLILNK